MPSAVSAPAFANSWNALRFLSINSKTNLAPSAAALIAPAIASPTYGIALAKLASEFATISINGFNDVKLVLPDAKPIAKLPNPLVRSPSPLTKLLPNSS